MLRVKVVTLAVDLWVLAILGAVSCVSGRPARQPGACFLELPVGLPGRLLPSQSEARSGGLEVITQSGRLGG
jgi:hypothetical protein